MVKIFKYIEELNCFVVDPQYKAIATSLGLTEWNEVVWIGRFFSLDNDYGEHWFDNWDLRECMEEKAKKLDIDADDLLIINPERFKNGVDGPCHNPSQREFFWKDVLISLHLSLDTIFTEARKINDERKNFDDEKYIVNLEDYILAIKNASP